MTRLHLSLHHGALRFILLMLFVGTITYGVLTGTRPSADEAARTATQQPSFAANRTILVQVMEDGTVAVEGLPVAETVRRLPAEDELRLEILNGRKLPIQGGQNIVIRLESDVILPSASNRIRIYAIHGAEVKDQRPTLPQPAVAEWTLTQLSSDGAVSLVVRYPRYSFNLGGRAMLRSLPALIAWWKWAAGGLAVLSLVGIWLWLINRSWHVLESKGAILNTPPSALSPGAAGALLYGRAGPAQLAATLVTMASRGDIQIVQSAAGYRVARRRPLLQTSPTEKILLEELRLSLGPVSHQESLESSLHQRLFDRKIAEAYGGLLDELRARGLFITSRTAHGWYRFAALILILISLVGGVASAYYLPEGLTLLGFWLGWFAAGWLTFSSTPTLPRLTRVGRQERDRWVQFYRYLTDPRPLGGDQSDARAFTLYLPYAIAFDATEAWLARFNQDFIHIPDWYFNTDNPASTTSFIKDVLEISTHIATDLTRAGLTE